VADVDAAGAQVRDHALPCGLPGQGSPGRGPAHDGKQGNHQRNAQHKLPEGSDGSARCV